MIAEKNNVFNAVSSSTTKSGERKERDSSKIKEMREREFRKRQKRERDIEIERANHEQTY